MPPNTPIAGYRTIYAKDPTTGEIFSIAAAAPPTLPPTALDDLTDVDTATTPPTGGQGLVWDQALGQWVPGVVTANVTTGWGLEVQPDGDVAVDRETLDVRYARHLADLRDVDLGKDIPAKGDVLTYDDVQSKWIPGSATPDEVMIGPDDPLLADPASPIEIWYDTDEIAPPGLNLSLEWWDPAVQYLTDHKTLWPRDDTKVWGASADNINMEPGAAATAPLYYTFPGGTTAAAGLMATTAPVFANGVELRVTTNGTIGDLGNMVSIGNDDLRLFPMPGGLMAVIQTSVGAGLMLQGPFTDPGAYSHIRVVVDTAALNISLDVSPDGSTWTVLDSLTYPAAISLPVTTATILRIGHDSTALNTYNGTLGEVVTHDPSTGAAVTSWVPWAQGTDGAGRSPATGEEYTLLAGTVLTPVDLVDVPSPWNLLSELPGPYLPLSGGTLTGKLTANATIDMNGSNIDRAGNLNFNGSKIIQFPNEADKAKILLYGSTSTGFGFGITSGTMNLFASSTIKFQANSITGAEWLTVAANGTHQKSAGHIYTDADGYGFFMNGGGGIYKKSGSGITIRKHSGNTMPGIEQYDGSARKDILVSGGGQAMGTHQNLELTSHLVINGSTASNSCHYYVNSDGNDSGSGSFFKVLEGRQLDNKTAFDIRGYVSAHSGGQPEGQMKVSINCGDDGYKEHTQFSMKDGGGQPRIHCHGDISALHFEDRDSFRAGHDDDEDLDLSLASQLIDRLTPFTYTRFDPPGVGASPDRVPQREHSLSISIEDIEGSGSPLVPHLIHSQPDDPDRGHDINALLVVAIAEIKNLRVRLAETEARLGVLEGS